jgi:hypothetical protein
VIFLEKGVDELIAIWAFFFALLWLFALAIGWVWPALFWSPEFSCKGLDPCSIVSGWPWDDGVLRLSPVLEAKLLGSLV